MPDPDLRLDGPWAVDDPDEAIVDGALVVDPAVDRLDLRADRPEEVLGQRRNVDAAEVAGDDQRRARRIERQTVRGTELVGIEAGDRLAGAAARSVVRRCRGVDRLRERLVRPPYLLRVVVFPAPLLPRIVTISPRSTAKDIPCTTSSSP